MQANRLVLATLAVGILGGVGATAGGGAVPAGGKPTEPAAGARIDLATYAAKRWVVQLDGQPLATYTGGVAGFPATMATATGASALNASSARSRAYVAHLQAVQRAFAGRLQSVVPGARVQRRYQVVLNGLGVRMSKAQAARVRRMAGVRAVTPDVPYHLDRYATPEQIGAPTLWNMLGGQSKAGNGVRVAVIDSGIFVRRVNGKYAGNRCFDDTGYSAPGGYPKGDTRFTNRKVIVARAYFRPSDPPVAGENTPIQGTNAADPHGTHTAGTIACDAGTEVDFQGAAHVKLSGIAPRAYLMNYRVFYPSRSADRFQNGNAYTVELVKAIDDAVKDGAQVISNSWGASYQNTLAWPDPMIKAAERATAAGVTMVFANGNAGPDEATANSPAISPKVIAVGAVTKNATIVPGDVSVTAPIPVAANLTGLAAGPAGFGPPVTTQTGPAPIEAAEDAASNSSSLGCSPAGDASPFPDGSLTGAIALIQRGACDFSEKVYNAQRGGAIAAVVYNSAANGDNLQSMGKGAHAADVTIPSWFLRRSDGLRLVSHAQANPDTAEAQFVYSPHPAANVGDVVAGFSSRGPSQDGLIKPDVVAPGVDVLSSGYGVGDFPEPFTGFGSASGTSMATPHVAGAAALLKQLHPGWRPAQIKSALMTTATEDVYLDTAKSVPAGVMDRGAGRIDLTQAGAPGLTVDQPSLSAGDLQQNQSVQFTVKATDTTAQPKTWTIEAVQRSKDTAGYSITPSPVSIKLPGNGSASFSVTVAAAPDAQPGRYEGEVVLVNASSGKQAHIPVWLRVLPPDPTADVLLVDDDGSSADDSFADYSARYTSLLDSLDVDYRYVDRFPGLLDLYGYRLVILFTGDNDSFDTSRLSPADQDNLTEWLDSGGRLWVTGQNVAEETDSNDIDSQSLGRARVYQGYLGLSEVADSAYDGSAPSATAEGAGPMMTAPTQDDPNPEPFAVDLGPGGSGAANQDSIEVATPMADNDTYAAAKTMTPLFRPLDSDYSDDDALAVSWGRSSEPRLEEERQEFRYRTVWMGFGMEAVNGNTGFTRPKAVAENTMDWLLDTITFGDPDNEVAPVDVTVRGKSGKHLTFVVNPFSSANAKWVRFRWDFGDRTKILTVDKDHPKETGNLYAPRIADHSYGRGGTYRMRVEATDTLGHSAIVTVAVKVR